MSFTAVKSAAGVSDVNAVHACDARSSIHVVRYRRFGKRAIISSALSIPKY